MKRKFDLIYVIFFFLIITLPVLSMLTGIEVRNSENRQLSQLPELYRDSRFNKGFPGEFDTYFSENFGLRPLFITGYAAINYYLLGYSINDQVIPGKEGWLYFNKTVSDFTGENIMSDYEIEKLVTVIQLQSDWLKQKGTRFIFMPVPNKNTIYPEFMPDRYKPRGKASNIELLGDAFDDTGINYINLVDLYRQVDDTQLYQKKDTHWNGYGAILGLKEILKAMNQYKTMNDLSLTDLLQNREIRSGDLANMLLPATGMKETQPVIEVKSGYRYLRHIRTLEDLRIETECDSDSADMNLLMFRDSFANTLIPVMSNLFRYCCYSRSVPLDYRITEERDFDVVVVEIVERNLRDIIENVPIMLSQPLEKVDFGNCTAVCENVIIRTGEEYGYTEVSGFIPDYLTNEIYVCVNDRVYPAFPIMNKSLQNEYKDIPGSEFTVYLKTPVDAEALKVVFQCQNQYITSDINRRR